MRKTLDAVEEGKEVIIKEILGGQGVKRRLYNLGIYPGIKVKVIKNALVFGPILVEVQGSEVALGRGMAAKVDVEWQG